MDGPLSDTELACRRFLLNYIQNDVLYEPSDNFRRCSRIEPMSVDPFQRSFTIPNEVVYLPDKDNKYYVWSIYGEDYLLTAGVPQDRWFSVAEVAERYHVLLHFYGTDGRMLSKEYTYIQIQEHKDISNTYRNIVFVAATQDMCVHCIRHTKSSDDVIRQVDDVYVTAYYENYNSKDIRIKSYRFDDLSSKYKRAELLREVNTLIASAQDLTYLSVYENGYEVTPHYKLHLNKINSDTYLDVIIDKNVLLYWDVPVVIKDSSDFSTTDSAYLSLRDRCWKQILHIPRALNPDNKVIAHNTLDFWVRKKNDAKPAGVYVHRLASNNRNIYQITHNDFAIALSQLKSYQNMFSDDGIYLHIEARNRPLFRYLKEDSHYIRVLYAKDFTDDDIVNLIAARTHEGCYWWKGEQLEQNKYKDFWFEIPHEYSKDLIETFIQALGYYKVIAILGQTKYDYTPSSSSYSISIPYLYRSRSVYPLTYIDKLFHRNTVYSVSDGKVHISSLASGHITSTILLTSGTRFCKSYVPYVAPASSSSDDSSSLSLIDTLGPPGYELPTSSYVVYTVENIRELEYTSEVCLVPTNDYTVTDGRIIFGSTSGATKYLIVSTNNVFEESYAIGRAQAGTTIALRTGVDDAPPVTPPSSGGGSDDVMGTSSVTSSGSSAADPEPIPIPICPQVGIPNIEHINVYLNGYYLSEGLEYRLEQRYHNGNYIRTDVVLLTDHHNTNSNTLSIVTHHANVLQKMNGYVQGRKIYSHPRIIPYDSAITLIYVDGQLRTDVIDRGIYFEVPEDADGKVFEIQMITVKETTSFLAPYLTGDNNTDAAKIAEMDTFFS